jgi:hypothetical protein
MTRILWAFALLAVSVWTLFAWGIYGLVNFFGDTAARNASAVTSYPAGVEWLSWGLSALRNVGLAAVVLVWGVVSVIILAVPTLLSIALGTLGRGRTMARGPAMWPPQTRWPSDEPRPGFRDVTPDKGAQDDEEIRLIERR